MTDKDRIKLETFGQRVRTLYHDALRLYSDLKGLNAVPVLPTELSDNLEVAAKRAHRALECMALYLAKHTGQQLTE